MISNEDHMHNATRKQFAVLGAGSWGSALAHLLASNNHQVSLWCRREELAQNINATHTNPQYLGDTTLHTSLYASSSLAEVCKDADALVCVVPSLALRKIAQDLKRYVDKSTPCIICSKGFEANTGYLPLEIFEEELGNTQRLAVLSGPNHAEEVVKLLPSATLIASSSKETARFYQEAFSQESFRCYTSSDVVGVEICAAYKNIIALAVGLSFGLGMGDNTAAMLMTRGLAEMSRLSVALGGDQSTCMGLAGMGDLVATCTSKHSRNRMFGEALASGVSLDEYQSRRHMVVEGARACKTIQVIAQKSAVELPIASVVHEVVWNGADPLEAGYALSMRPLKPEF